MAEKQILEADLTWTGESFEPGVRIAVDADGVIESVSRDEVITGTMPVSRRLRDQALIPGFVNAHSHAFQRGLRGKAERFPSAGGSFWTWREEMYRLAESLTPDQFFELSRQAFQEMLACGITAVGEFHYLHHDSTDGDFALDDALLAAAHEAGIRLVLLNAYYASGGINRPLQGAQFRFRIDTLSDYWRQIDLLGKKLHSPLQSLGAVVHSVRAAAIKDIESIHREALSREMPFHMHVEEQRQEIEDCQNVHGVSPMRLLLDRLQIGPEFTAVHCTHTSPKDLEDFLDRGGSVCFCPLTEANLGDGIADLTALCQRDSGICVGTDSNSRLCFNEELRWLEYVQRLNAERRGVFRDSLGSVARRLLQIGTAGGARSLGLPTGEIRVGCPADFVAIDLKASALAGVATEDLLAAFLLGTGIEAVHSSCVAGRWFNRRVR